MSKTIIGVMGPGREASVRAMEAAFVLGQLIAEENWVLLCGGRAAGVMEAASRGAKSAGGLTVGILPGRQTHEMSQAIDIPILTDLGEARNNLNVLSSRIVFACGMEAGTASEVALAIKAQKQVVLLEASAEAQAFFTQIGAGYVFFAGHPHEAIEMAKELLAAGQGER